MKEIEKKKDELINYLLKIVGNWESSNIKIVTLRREIALLESQEQSESQESKELYKKEWLRDDLRCSNTEECNGPDCEGCKYLVVVEEQSEREDGVKESAEEKCCKIGDYKCHVPTNLKDKLGRVISVDKCLKEAVENLNAHGIKTIASCCGHGVIQPSIVVELKEQPKDGVKESAEEYIKNQWGEAWLRNQWDACDVIDSLQEYAEAYHKQQMRGEIIKWMEDYYEACGGIDDYTIKHIDEYLKDK